jgi:hypothetical protein
MASAWPRNRLTAAQHWQRSTSWSAVSHRACTGTKGRVMTMSDILNRIEAYKRDEIAAAKAALPARRDQGTRGRRRARADFIGAIEAKHGAGGYALIAEIKKASPPRA